MTDSERLHHAQVHILHTLRHVKVARFSDLMSDSGMTSDGFKHHTNKLLTKGFIKKQEAGSYILTAVGKEYANRLDEKNRNILQQPKTSTLMVVQSVRNDETKYLLHERTREPYYGFWGIASAPLQYGVSIFDSSRQEFLKQTGLDLSFSVHGSLRVTDISNDGKLLEDKLFTILVARIDGCPKLHRWHGGRSEWVSLADIATKHPLFPSTFHILDMVENDISFDEVSYTYTETEY